MDDIRVSVVVPMYNGADHIVKCINQYDSQDCSFTYEVIIVDDCSTDGSVALVEKHLTKLQHSKRFHLIKSEKNGRAGSARNIGVKAASGHYVLFNDQDDYPDIEMLKVLWNSSQDGNVDLVSCAVMDRRGVPYYRPVLSANHLLGEKERSSLIGNYGYVFGSLIKRSILLKNRLCFAENVMFEDVLFNDGLLTCVERIQTIKQVLYYREDDHNSQTAIFTPKKLNDRIDATKYYLEMYKNNPIIAPYLSAIKVVGFYYIYLSVMLWLLVIPRLYTKNLFNRCLSEGRLMQISWKDVIDKNKNFNKPLLLLLKMIYYVPIISYPVRFVGTIAYRVFKMIKKNTTTKKKEQ